MKLNIFKKKLEPTPFLSDVVFTGSYEELHQKRRTVIDHHLYKLIKAELKGGWDNRSIAEFFDISGTTLNLIRQSKNFKQYKILRRKHSKPYAYK